MDIMSDQVFSLHCRCGEHSVRRWAQLPVWYQDITPNLTARQSGSTRTWRWLSGVSLPDIPPSGTPISPGLNMPTTRSPAWLQIVTISFYPAISKDNVRQLEIRGKDPKKGKLIFSLIFSMKNWHNVCRLKIIRKGDLFLIIILTI